MFKTNLTTAAHACFKRWARTPWAAFTSLGHAVTIGVLSVANCIVVAGNNSLQAQNRPGIPPQEQDTVYLLDSVVVQAHRPSPFSPRSRVLATLSGAEISAVPVIAMPDLLRYVPGVDLRSRGTDGVQADLNILGGTFDQTRLYLNGIDFTDPQTGHHSLNIPLIPSLIKRIQVLQTPQALNLVTTDKRDYKEPFSAQIGLSGGTHGALETWAQLAYAGIQLGGGYNRCNGYTPNTDYEIGQIFATTQFRPMPDHALLLQAGYQNKKFGAQSFYTPKYPEQYEETSVLLSSLSYEYSGASLRPEIALYQRTHWDEFQLFRYTAPEWYTGHNYHRSNLLGARAALSYDWNAANATSLGGEVRYEHILSSNLGLPMETPQGHYKKQLGRTVPSVFLKHALRLAQVQLNGDVTWWNRLLLWSLSGTFTPSPQWQISLHSGSSARNPSFTDLFYQSPTQEGNSSLRPEQFILSSVGVDYRHARRPLSFYLRLFHRYGYRIIDWVRKTNQEQWQATNLTGVHSVGVETGVQYGPVQLRYSGLTVNKNAAGLHSLYATDYLQHKVVLMGLHHLPRRYALSWNISWNKRAGTYLGADNQELPYKPFTLVNVRLQKEFSFARNYTVQLFVMANNLLNLRYSDIGGIPQPGITAKAGLSLRFSE